MNMPLVLLNRRRRGAFNPAYLFALAEPGVWYDPSDLTTLFQDNAGTTPVTAAGQTVGLMLDKSQGLVLGSELVTNGGPFVTTTGWTAGLGSVAVVGDALVLTCATNGRVVAPALTGLVIGNTYKIVVSGVGGDAGTKSIRITTNSDGSTGALFTQAISGRSISYMFVATATTHYLALVATGSTGQTFSITGASVKLLAGNHATQPTLAQRPTYGINPIVGTRNLLTYTEQFDNAAWVKESATVSADTSVSPDGTSTADRMLEAATTAAHAIAQTNSSLSATEYVFSAYLKKGTGATAPDWVQLSFGGASTGFANFNLSTGVVGVTTATAAISSVGSGWYRCSLIVSVAVAGAASVQIVFTNNADTATRRPSYAGATTSDVLVWGAQLELGSTVTAYQKVVSQYEVTQAGVQSVSYLAFDGVDDGMVTNTITPAIDKVQVFAGVRKLSDAGGAVAELSATIGNNGTFGFYANGGSSNDFYLGLNGSTTTFSKLTTYNAPITVVISAIFDIAGASNATEIIPRVNATTPTITAEGAANAGTGNFLAYPLYLGRRGGTTIPYNGRIYSLIVRFGPNLTDGQITSTESWVNAKVGAY